MPGRGGRSIDQLDLLAWEPPEIVRRYPEERVRTATLESRIARAVSETLNDSDKSRGTIAQEMSVWLGKDVTENMLNRYASEAHEQHTISYIRLLALCHVTGDMRLMQMGAELFGHSVVDDRYLDWVEIGELAELRDEINKQLDARRRSVRRNTANRGDRS